MSQADVPDFTAAQRRALAYVLDDLIPPSADGRLPGAGTLDLATDLDGSLRRMPELKAMIVEGLVALDALAKRRHPHGLEALSPAECAAVLNELASSEQAIPPVLILHAYAGYYHHPRIIEALGLEPRPPHPIGYEMAPNDLSLLDPVRRRGPIYRQC